MCHYKKTVKFTITKIDIHQYVKYGLQYHQKTHQYQVPEFLSGNIYFLMG